MSVSYSSLKKEVLSNKKKSFDDEDLTYQELKERTKAARNTYGVDENYINSFVKDANSYISSAQSDIEKLNYQNAKDQYDQRSSRSAELKSRANTIRAYLNANKDRVDSNSRNQLLSFIDGFDKQSDDIFNNFMRAAQRVSQFPSETEYNFDLNNNIEKTKRETLPRIAQQVAEDYLQNRMGYDTIAKYDDNTRYSDVSSDIEHLKQLRGGAARRDKDTGVYDRALEMLKSYASQNYSLDDPSLSLEDRNAIYNQNKRDIADLSGEGNDEYTRDYSLMRWLGMYDKNALSSDETNQTAIDLINKNNVKYDVSLDVGDLNDEEKKKKADELRTYFKNKYGYADDTDYLAAANDFYKSKKAKYEKAKVDNKAYERLGQASAVTSDINKKDDYEQNSIAGDYGTPTTRDEINEYFNTVNSEKVEAAKTGYERVKAKSEIDSNVLPDKLGSFMAAEDKEIAKTPNTYVQIRQDIAGAGVAVDNYDRLKSEGYKKHWEAMNGEEIGAYYYLLNTEGKDAAYEYLDSLSSTLQKRANYENKKKEMELSGEQGTLTNLDWIVRNASTVPDKVVGGVAGYIDNASHYITGEDLEPYSNIHGASLSATATREAAGETLDKKLGADGTSRWAVKPSQLYQGVMSAADMATALAVGPEVYGASMGMSAAEDTARELWEQGEDNDTINAISTAAGTAEMLFEELSLDKIIKISNLAGTNTAKGLVKNYLLNMVKSSGIEASEEVLTEAANMVVDYAVRGDRSDEAGYSFEDVANRLYQAGVGGAIGGLLGGGGATTLSATAKGAELIQNQSERNQYIRNVGEDVTGAGNAQALLDRAAQMDDPAVKAQAQRTQQALDKANQNNTKTANNRLSRETGKLYAAMQDSTAQGIQNAEANEIKAAIKSAYAAETGKTDSTEISKAADAIYKSEYTDERLTRSERNLAETAAAQSALESVKNNPDLIESATQKAQERGFRDYVETAKLTQKQETKTDDDVDIAEFNYHEDDGKVYASDGKKQVDIASVASIGDNDITFNLNDGQTESAKSLDMPTNQAVLAQSILDVQKKIGVPLTADIANTLYQGYEQSDSPSVSAYIQDAQTVLFNGYANNTAPDSSINLPQELRDQLYRMGRQLAASHTQSQQQNVNARVKGNKSRKGTVTFQDGINRNRLDPRRRAGVDAVEHLSQSLGFDVVFYRSTKDGKGRFSSEYVRKNKFVADGQQAPSGFWRGGKMYLDINAGMNGEGLILFTASHELVHMIREGSPEDFKALSDFLVKNYAEQGVDINDLVRKEMARSTNLTRDQALEEVIAESCESFLRDTTLNDKAQDLYKQNPTLWSRIREALKRIVDAVKQWYAVASPQSKEARITNRAGVETLEQAYDLWTKGIIKSAENLRNMERESTDTKYQGRAESQDTEYLDAVERGDMETAQRMVDEAAKASGAYTQYGSYTPELFYHGTRAEGFTEFRYSRKNQTGTDYGKAFYFTTDYEKAKGYAYDISKDSRVNDYKAERDRLTKEFLKSPTTENKERLKKHHETLYEIIDGDNNGGLQKGTEVKSTYLFMKNPLVVDANGEYYYKVYPDYFKAAKQLGSDGIVVHNVVDNPRGKARPITVGIVFESNQIKSADPVTYDDNGDVIPLSERFNESNKDIRYQSRDNTSLSAKEIREQERQRWEKREKELKEHFKEQRAKNVQKRNLTKQKNIVARKLRSLDKKLNRSNKDKTVKEGLRPTAAKLLEVGNMLFPETRSLEEMAREGVSDATPAEKKLLDKYVTYLDMRERATTKEQRERMSKMLSYIRKQLSKEGISVEVTENGKTVKKKMSVTARERMRYDNSMREYNKLKLRTALTELEDAYSTVKNSPDGYIADSFDPTIIDLIKDLKNDVGDTLAKDMNSAQLQTLNDIVTRALKSITNANKLFLQSKSMTDTATAVMNDVKHIRKLKDMRNLPMYKAGEFLGWTNFKPIYAMRFIGSDTLTQLYWNIQRGESNWYVDIAEAKAFKDKLDEKYGVGKLNTKKKTDFNYNKKATFYALDGSEFTLNLDQMMDIYAASRREQALQHLLKGGFTFAKDAKGDKFGTLKTGAKVYQLTAETISDIADQLTVNEKKYVEVMQKYLSTVMADKGNEVSMQLHGVKLFNEEIYWSISSTDIYAPQSEVEQQQKNDLVKKIRNAGFTKSTVKNASNPIVVQGFEEKWAGHVNEMSLYHAMTLPLEDFTKVVNYRERGKDAKATTGVRGVLNQAYGNAASNYINQLIDDLNGGIQQRMRVDVADTLVSLAKKGAVLTNLSVVIQQPSSLFRAMAYINPRYFVKATGNKFWSFEDKRFSWTKHNKAYEELIKYAPIAGIKRMGSFDTGSGRGVIDYLSSGGRENLAQRAYRKSEDIASFMPEYADELAWIKIWQAVQHETQAKYGYKVGTEQNKIKSGERFTEVVHLTQVYDSTLSRSHAMRGKDFGSKMLTSFMAEPTTYMNMAVDAVVQSKRTHNFKQLAKTMSGLSMALIANALLVAIPRAMRDDDEEETFADKYLQAFWDDIVSGVNPLNYFPILKDIMSTIEGHSNERMDMTIIGNAISSITKAFENIQKDKFSGNDVINILGAAAACVGFSLKNLVRDIRSVINTVNTFKNAHYFKEADEMGLYLPYVYQKAYDNAWDKGYSEKECESKAESAARDKIANALKSKYLEAFESNDTESIKEIRQYMLQSGYYHSKKKNGSDLSAVDDTLASWRDKDDEADNRAKVAEERKNNK